jgi:hypothetical protein
VWHSFISGKRGRRQLIRVIFGSQVIRIPFFGKRYSENGFGRQGKCDRRILWSGQGPTIGEPEFRAGVHFVRVSRAPMAPGNLKKMKIDAFVKSRHPVEKRGPEVL